MVTGHPPFSAATPKDAYYKALALGKEDVFWRQHEKQIENNNEMTSEFRDLMNKMLQLDPNERPNI